MVWNQLVAHSCTCHWTFARYERHVTGSFDWHLNVYDIIASLMAVFAWEISIPRPGTWLVGRVASS